MSRRKTSQPFDFDVATYPALPRRRGLLITATDTEVGKTMIAGAIARTLLDRGHRVEVFKPAASGCRREREGLIATDAEFLAACAESRRPLAEIAPVRYAEALAPNVAAERARRPVDLEAMFDAYVRVTEDADCVIVEGVGGLLCPLSDDFWVIHLAKLLHLPLAIVARPTLGTINHTLLTLQTARAAGLDVAGVVINRYQLETPVSGSESHRPHTDAELAMMTNPAQIAERGRVEVLAIVPDDAESSVEEARLGADVLFAVGQVDWERFL